MSGAVDLLTVVGPFVLMSLTVVFSDKIMDFIKFGSIEEKGKRWLVFMAEIVLLSDLGMKTEKKVILKKFKEAQMAEEESKRQAS
ncbi:hypothetical protein KHA80_06530 [Anaerobacillus sp. HL2]|nr:hypothetical protein KHA80_06530 [Anaerobacillus sp. HL2]